MFSTRLQKIFLYVAAMLLLGNTAVWWMVFTHSQKDAKKELIVAVMNIGQGDAIYIEAPNGKQVVVDGGPDAKILHELGKLIPWYDKSLDMLVITNPDKDHIAGFVDVLKRFKVNYLLESGTENSSLVNNEVERLAKADGVKEILARRGMQIFLDENAGVTLTILFPDRDVSKEKTNDGSIVIRLTYGDTAVMLTGDAPTGVESHLLSLPSSFSSSTPELSLRSDILKVGHHGSRTSTSEAFVRAVAPKFAAISCGLDNKYGHPHQETLDTLSAAKPTIKIFRTDQDGTIIFKSDGRKFVKEG